MPPMYAGAAYEASGVNRKIIGHSPPVPAARSPSTSPTPPPSTQAQPRTRSSPTPGTDQNLRYRGSSKRPSIKRVAVVSLGDPNAPLGNNLAGIIDLANDLQVI